MNFHLFGISSILCKHFDHFFYLFMSSNTIISFYTWLLPVLYMAILIHETIMGLIMLNIVSADSDAW